MLVSQALLNRGANIQVLTESEATPLMIASHNGQLPVVEVNHVFKTHSRWYIFEHDWFDYLRI